LTKGRRKKEPVEVHRNKIASSAEKLFRVKGIEGTTMDEVAAEAGYSKATLYVYFKNKQDIVHVLALRGMTMLHTRICTVIASCTGTEAQYMALCTELVRYQEQFPFYFTILQAGITKHFENCTETERKIFE
jgi:AcrR family transcriptional regulator